MSIITLPEEKDIISQRIRRIFEDEKVKKILLVNPPDVSVSDIELDACLKKRYSSFPPYGLLILSDAARKKGYDVRILDMNYNILSHIQGIKSLSDFNEVWRHDLEKTINDFKPDLIGVTSMFTMKHSIFCEVCAEIKKYDIPIVAGGVYVSNDTERVLAKINNENLIACLFESEVAFPNLLDFINNRNAELTQLAMIIGGKYYSISERVQPKDGDINFFPAFDLIETSKYSSVGSIGSFVSLLDPNTKISTVLSNKGCRGMCSFCSVRHFNGLGVRSRSIKSVADEIEVLNKKYGIGHIMWLDDDLFFNEKRAIGLFEEIKGRDLGITWDASNGVVAASCTPDLIESAAESGCIGLYFGIESGNPETLLKIRKPATIDNFRKASKIMKVYPQIFTRGFLMIGFPDETLRMMMDTMNLALELSMDWYGINIVQPLPSTSLHEVMVKRKLLENNMESDNLRYMIGTYGKASQIERREEKNINKFINPFDAEDLDIIPDKSQLKDIWFYMNFKINYERIKAVKNPVKQKMLKKTLVDICDRITTDHALANLFLAMHEKNLGNEDEMKKRLNITIRCLDKSTYWQDKFGALNLYKDLDLLQV